MTCECGCGHGVGQWKVEFSDPDFKRDVEILNEQIRVLQDTMRTIVECPLKDVESVQKRGESAS